MQVIVAHVISLKWRRDDNVFIGARISGGALRWRQDKLGHGHGNGRRL
jgi:hypothetical protein